MADHQTLRGPLLIERDRKRISFTIECSDEDIAILLYNQATAEAHCGMLDIRWRSRHIRDGE